MSDNSESFEKWAFNYTNNSTTDVTYTLSGLAKIIARDAWNARGEIEQKKIDELEKKLCSLKSTEHQIIEQKLQAAEKENKILREAVEEFQRCEFEDWQHIREHFNEALEKAGGKE